MARYVLFDLDGTLTDSREGIYRSLRYALEKLGRPAPPEEVLRLFIGPPLTESFPRYCRLTEEQTRAGIRFFQERYNGPGKFENTAAPGMRDLLEQLCARGYTLALASSKPEEMCGPICDHFGFTPYLAVISGGASSENMTKAEVIQKALRLLGNPDVSRCLMVGDRKYDVEGARACGIPCAGVDFFGFCEEGELERAGAVCALSTAEDLQRFILERYPV